MDEVEKAAREKCESLRGGPAVSTTTRENGYTETVGVNRGKWSGYKELMALLRIQLDAYCAPRGIGYLLSSRTASMFFEVCVTVVSAPYHFAADPKFEYDDFPSLEATGNRSELSVRALADAIAILNIVDSFNSESSEAMSDYSNSSFYRTVAFSRKLDSFAADGVIPIGRQKALSQLRRDLVGRSVAVVRSASDRLFKKGDVLTVGRVKADGFGVVCPDGKAVGLSFGQGASDVYYSEDSFLLRSGSAFRIV